MIKVRLKRVKRLVPEKYFDSSAMDVGFIKGKIEYMPKKGAGIVFFPGENRFACEWWRTTSVTKIIRHKTLVMYQTLNSQYHIKKGWGK